MSGLSGASSSPEAARSTDPALLARLLNRQALAALALAAIVAVSFHPAFQAGFVWDDAVFTGEPLIRSPTGLSGIWFSPRELGGEAHYWPMTYTSFWLEHRLWGYEPLGYHVVNVLLHLVNVLLLWRLLARLSVPGAWLAAALFAVHPLKVESVVWIVERKDVLSGLFYLTAFLSYLRFVKDRSALRYGLALVLFTAGLLSKTVVVTLPAALVIWHWWDRRGRPTLGDLLPTVPFFVTGLGTALADTAFYRTREVLDLGYSLVDQVLIASRVLCFYVGKLAWPTDLAVIYPLWEIDARSPQAWGYLVLTAAAATVLWFGRRRWGLGPAACAAFYVATLSPALGVIEFGYMQFSLVADRFQYLAGIGVFVLVAAAATKLHERLRQRTEVRDSPLRVGATGGGQELRAPTGEAAETPTGGTADAPAPRFARLAVAVGGPVAVAVVLLLLGTLTASHARKFRDEVTLFSHIVSLNPKARAAHLNLSYALNRASRFEESLEASLAAVELRPDISATHSNAGLAFMNLDRYEEAEASLRRAMELNPHDQDAVQNMGALRRRQDRDEEAADFFRQATSMNADDAKAWALLAETLFQSGLAGQAIEPAKRAIEVDPWGEHAAAMHLLLGRANRDGGDVEEAERHFLRTIDIAPDEAEPLQELALLHVEMERFDEAETYTRRAERLAPTDADTLHARAELLRRRKRHDEAIDLYRQALEADDESPSAHAGLGIAFFELERYEEAIGSIGRALDLEPEITEAPILHRMLGQAHQYVGRPEDAIPQFERALELDAEDAVALDHLAFLAFNAGRLDDAVGRYLALLELEEANPTAHANLGITFLNQGRYGEAAPHLERSLELDPDQPTTRGALAETLRRRDGASP